MGEHVEGFAVSGHTKEWCDGYAVAKAKFGGDNEGHDDDDDDDRVSSNSTNGPILLVSMLT